jgi:hypothetical protein
VKYRIISLWLGGEVVSSAIPGMAVPGAERS